MEIKVTSCSNCPFRHQSSDCVLDKNSGNWKYIDVLKPKSDEFLEIIPKDCLANNGKEFTIKII